jgi:hypothetical protein
MVCRVPPVAFFIFITNQPQAHYQVNNYLIGIPQNYSGSHAIVPSQQIVGAKDEFNHEEVISLAKGNSAVKRIAGTTVTPLPQRGHEK